MIGPDWLFQNSRMKTGREAGRLSMGKIIWRSLVGFAIGYALYLPSIPIVELAIHGRVDQERAFYALYYAIGAPFLLTPSGREYLQPDELALNLVGLPLIALCITAANTERGRKLWPFKFLDSTGS